MTRLTTSDICDISNKLVDHDRELLSNTGRSLFGIACHAIGADESNKRVYARSFNIHVIPVTSGLGVISDFSETVCAILVFLGFKARISKRSDVCGIAGAYEEKADAVMMADDHKFVGINLNSRMVADNTEMTGQVFAAALDLSADGLKYQTVLIMGCGPVGKAAAMRLLAFNAKLVLCDKNITTAQTLKKQLLDRRKKSDVKVEKHDQLDILKYQYIIEATSSGDTITDKQVSAKTIVAAPGVPLGVSLPGCRMLAGRLVHDKLELGVAAMAVSLLL